MPQPLTERQSEVLKVIQKAPLVRSVSYREIGRRLGCRSPNAMVAHLRALEQKGYIRLRPGRHGIELLETEAGRENQ